MEIEKGKIVIFDDEIMHIKRIEKELKKYFGDEEIYSFTKINKEFLQENIIDLALFDIEFDYGVNGLEFVNELRREIGFDLNIVFISSHENLRPNSQALGAIYFVDKAYLEQDMKIAMDSLKARGFRQQRILETTKGFIKIGHVMYIESKNKNILFHLANGGNIEEKGKLDKKEIELSKYHFIRCHKSYLINPEYLTTRDKLEAVMEEGVRLPISQKFSKEFDTKFRKFIIHKFSK